MSIKINEVYQDGVYFTLWKRKSGGYIICRDGKKIHSITTLNEEIAINKFNDYIKALL